MSHAHIVVHYHELWLKGGNRSFFLHKLREALRRALDGITIERISRPADRLIITLRNQADLDEALGRMERVSGISHYSAAVALDRRDYQGQEAAMRAICAAAWTETSAERFSTFAVRASRGDKRFPLNAMGIEKEVGTHLLQQARAAGREVQVNLKKPELTCWIEIAREHFLIYARRIAGAGGLPANTAGKLVCLLSGGFDSSVAAFKMMRRGGHLIFVHFWGGGGQAGESSQHVARQVVERLTPWQFTAKLYLVPFEPLQRTIAARSPEGFRTILYRRLMLRIAERVALRGKAKGVVTGDSLGQVASQTLQNLLAVGKVARLAVYRPLVGDDKLEIQEIARRIGTYDISAEPFHDCCPRYQSKSPTLFALPAMLEAIEARLQVEDLVKTAVTSMSVERFRYVGGRVERVQPLVSAPVE